MASITYQNYFRLYDKLAGMTGTALTEATEFMKIYDLSVVQVPTNRPMVRDDRNDQVYKTKEGKWSAVVEEIAERNAKRPAGARRHDLGRGLRAARRAPADSAASSTRSSTRSPSTPSERARRSPRPGRPGAVTIATNMAGRGVDIKLGGSPEHLDPPRAGEARPAARRSRLRGARGAAAAGARTRAARRTASTVMEAGGLCIIGTERHESRRIDNQLRGRAGRQGDPGRVALLPVRRGRPRAPVRGRAHLPHPRPLRHDRRPGPRGADRGRPADEADREGAEEGRGAELPDPQARARLRRRHERAAAHHLRLPRRGARRARHGRAGARGDREHARRASSTSSPRATTPKTGTSRACSRASPRYSRSASGSKTSTRPARTARS